MRHIIYCSVVLFYCLCLSCQRGLDDDPAVESKSFINVDICSGKPDAALAFIGDNQTRAEVRLEGVNLASTWNEDDILLVVGEELGVLGTMELDQYLSEAHNYARFHGSIDLSIFPEKMTNKQYVHLYYIHNVKSALVESRECEISISDQDGRLPQSDSKGNTLILHYRTPEPVDFDYYIKQVQSGHPETLHFGEKVIMSHMLSYVCLKFESEFTDSSSVGTKSPRLFDIGGCFSSAVLDLKSGSFSKATPGKISLNTTYKDSDHFYLTLIPNLSSEGKTVIQMRELRKYYNGGIYNGLLAVSAPANVRPGKFYCKSYVDNKIVPMALNDSTRHIYEESNLVSTGGDILYELSGRKRLGVIAGYRAFSYEFAPVNLGTDFSNSGFNTSDYGMLYQWGRRSGHGMYDQQLSPYDHDPAVTDALFQRNPLSQPATWNDYNYFYGARSPKWFSISSVDNIWNAGDETDPVKRIGADPCPEGWRVPTAYEMKSFAQVMYFSNNPPSHMPGFVAYRDEDGNEIHAANVMGESGSAFLIPLGGCRNENGGGQEKGVCGWYVTSSKSDASNKYEVIYIDKTEGFVQKEAYYTRACSVRCIHDYSFDYSML